MSDEVDKVLSKTPTLERALGRFPAVIIVLFALWTLRPKTGIPTLLVAIWAILEAWIRFWT
jgi:hypothetical protein